MAKKTAKPKRPKVGAKLRLGGGVKKKKRGTVQIVEPKVAAPRSVAELKKAKLAAKKKPAVAAPKVSARPDAGAAVCAEPSLGHGPSTVDGRLPS